ncbi:MAG: hypothetical protein GY759_20305 [Chloroflexi bacterium]|nr:hypothetical protein [Chloroflexota bacterium]
MRFVKGLWQVEVRGRGVEWRRECVGWWKEQGGGRLRAPVKWVREIGEAGDDDTIEEGERKGGCAMGEWRTEVTSLLNLATMVEKIQAQEEAESLPEVCDEPSFEACVVGSSPAPISESSAEAVGKAAAVATTGNGAISIDDNILERTPILACAFSLTFNAPQIIDMISQFSYSVSQVVTIKTQVFTMIALLDGARGQTDGGPKTMAGDPVIVKGTG